MLRSTLLLAITLAACSDLGPPATTPEPAPASTVSTPTRPAPVTPLNLPSLAGTPAASRVADGDPSPPTIHSLPDGRRFIHDGYRDRITLEDPTTGVRTDLGEVTLVAVPRLGHLIVPKTEPAHYHDVDPTAPRLRPLWRTPDHPEPTVLALVTLVGLDRGAPLFLVRHQRVAPIGAAPPPFPTVELVRLAAPGSPEIRVVPISADHAAPSADAVRDHRLLLLGPHRDLPAGDPPSAWRAPFSAPVSVLDLRTLAVRPLGDARGDWTDGTAVPHPYIAVRWTDHDAHARDHGWAEGCINTVDPTHERLVPCTPRP